MWNKTEENTYCSHIGEHIKYLQLYEGPEGFFIGAWLNFLLLLNKVFLT